MYRLRKIDKNDRLLLFEWANDPNVRANAKNLKPITWEEHVAWFDNIISNNSIFTYILVGARESIGMIRFNIDSGKAIITYSINKKYRGQGFGKLIVKTGMKTLENIIDKPVFVAYVKKDNIASEKIFNKLGFAFKKMEIIANTEFKIFQK